MLSQIDIQNFALIQKQTLSFSNGFHVITGETGAGKSILLGALQLVLGKRADINVLLNTNEKCIVEAVFQLKNYHLQPFFEANDLDYDDETTIRREIYPTGKSRAFINDVPVNLQVLNNLSLFLIDIHSQHQTLEITKNDFQFNIIDSYANNKPLQTDYRLALKKFKADLIKLDEKETAYQQILKEQSFNLFLLNELAEAKIVLHEEIELESDMSKLQHAENILQNLAEIIQLSDNEQFGIIQQLKIIKHSLTKISKYSSSYQALEERLDALLIEYKDIFDEVTEEVNRIEVNPSKMEILSQRLDLINQLQRKHLVKDTAELLNIYESLQNKEADNQSLALEIEQLNNDIKTQKEILNQFAEKLHQNRLKVKDQVANEVEKIIHQLGMKEASFSIVLEKTTEFNSFGQSEIDFLVATNKGSAMQKISKASGGELSRIVLALKSILAQNTKLPTIIFDEIDTGVSGDIANKMAEIMQDMSQTMQIIAITHLPQIASKGDVHYKVYKSNATDQTTTFIKTLNQNERINEIAQMISGDEITTFALDHAKSLIKQIQP